MRYRAPFLVTYNYNYNYNYTQGNQNYPVDFVFAYESVFRLPPMNSFQIIQLNRIHHVYNSSQRREYT